MQMGSFSRTVRVGFHFMKWTHSLHLEHDIPKRRKNLLPLIYPTVAGHSVSL